MWTLPHAFSPHHSETQDNLLNQRVALAVLKRCGIKAALANNGQEAVDFIEAGHEFNLILMDCMMPVMARVLRDDFHT